MTFILIAFQLFISLAVSINPASKIISGLADDNDSITIGQPATEFDLLDLDGMKICLSSHRGHYVVIHLATTWCPFCNTEAPYLEELSQN